MKTSRKSARIEDVLAQAGVTLRKYRAERRKTEEAGLSTQALAELLRADRLARELGRLLRAVEAARRAERERRSKAGKAAVRKYGKEHMRAIARKGGWPKGRPRKPKGD